MIMNLKIAIVLLLQLLFISNSFSQEEKETSIASDIGRSYEIIKSTSLGEIKIGMSIEEFLQLSLNNRTIRKELINLEGDYYDIYNIYEDDQIVYSVEPDEEKVWRIWIYGKNLKTEKGIGIGNSLGEIRKHYKIKYFSVGEGQVAIILEDFEYSFLLDSRQIRKKWWSEQSLDGLEDEILINLIII
jgi:hypothetical protein